MLKLGLAVFFAMNVMVFSMALWSHDVYGEDLKRAGPLADAVYDLFRYLALVFCVPVLFLLGGPLAEGVGQALRRRLLTSDLLLLVGVSAAIGYSIWSVVTGVGHIYFDVATMILVFVTLGRWFEAQGKLRAGHALDALANLLPEQVHLIRDDLVVDVARHSVVVGDTLSVLPGERFAVDGVISSGCGEVDEQIVTGEGHPVLRGPGDRVWSGTLNTDGSFHVVVTAPAGKETVSRMLELVRKARRARGHYQKLADRIAARFVFVVGIVALAAACWHGQRDRLDAGILTGLAVFLIACPCALGLATPLAVWMALGRAARSQVLFRSGQALEQLAGVRTMLFDKTGTLTTGDSRVRSFVALQDEEANQTLEFGAQLASASSHWTAVAIRRFAECTTGAGSIREARTIPGKGIEARWNADGKRILLGSVRWLDEEGYGFSEELWRSVESADGIDAPIACVGWRGKVHGVFIFHERLRPDAGEALERCRRLGIDVRVVTGDRRQRAKPLTEALGVPLLAGQLPEDKVAIVHDARSRGTVAMVGDGINDAPALAASDVGIAMGCSADLSRDSAAVCLLSDDLARLPWVVGLARQTVRVIRQNLCWAFGYNLVGIGLAATGRLNPVFAALAMVASSAFVIGNSLRLNRFPAPAQANSGLSAGAAAEMPGSANYGPPPESSVSLPHPAKLQPTT